MVDLIENLLQGHCDIVERVSKRTTRDTWREWNQLYPLDEKPPHSTSEDTIVDRLGAVTRSVCGRGALETYRRIHPAVVFVMTVGKLTGDIGPLLAWRCEYTTPPPMDDVDVNLIVTSIDYAWTFGSPEVFRRSPNYEGFVYIEPELFPPPSWPFRKGVEPHLPH